MKERNLSAHRLEYCIACGREIYEKDDVLDVTEYLSDPYDKSFIHNERPCLRAFYEKYRDELTSYFDYEIEGLISSAIGGDSAYE